MKSAGNAAGSERKQNESRTLKVPQNIRSELPQKNWRRFGTDRTSNMANKKNGGTEAGKEPQTFKATAKGDVRPHDVYNGCDLRKKTGARHHNTVAR